MRVTVTFCCARLRLGGAIFRVMGRGISEPCVFCLARLAAEGLLALAAPGQFLRAVGDLHVPRREKPALPAGLREIPRGLRVVCGFSGREARSGYEPTSGFSLGEDQEILRR
jgi:hypothetical protein